MTQLGETYTDADGFLWECVQGPDATSLADPLYAALQKIEEETDAWAEEVGPTSETLLVWAHMAKIKRLSRAARDLPEDDGD